MRLAAIPTRYLVTRIVDQRYHHHQRLLVGVTSLLVSPLSSSSLAASTLPLPLRLLSNVPVYASQSTPNISTGRPGRKITNIIMSIDQIYVSYISIGAARRGLGLPDLQLMADSKLNVPQLESATSDLWQQLRISSYDHYDHHYIYVHLYMYMYMYVMYCVLWV
jgi:hypothetical protein